jgi:hypothetical protein
MLTDIRYTTVLVLGCVLLAVLMGACGVGAPESTPVPEVLAAETCPSQNDSVVSAGYAFT